jgi:hypothetical protein
MRPEMTETTAMAVKSETRHSAVFDVEERAGAPNGIDGGGDEVPTSGSFFPLALSVLMCVQPTFFFF